MLVPRGFVKGKTVEAIWDLDDSHHLLLHRQFVRQIAVVQRNRNALFLLYNVYI